MKELRSVGGHLRLLFAFDPKREAFVCVGGDKANDWTGWYDRNIPLADDRYDEHLKEPVGRLDWRQPMPKNKTWRELRAETITTSERDAEVKAGAQAIVLQSRLAELRQKRSISQQTLADALGVSQARVSTLEHTDDVLVSTLTRYIEGLGGHVEIRAVFDDEAIELLS